MLDYAYLNSINDNLVKLLKDNGAKKLSEKDDLEENFEERYGLLDKGFGESGIYDIIDDFKRNRNESSSKIPFLLDTLKEYIFEERYVEGNEYLSDIEDIISESGNESDRLIFLYLKASIYLCLNVSIESIKREAKELLNSGAVIYWDFDGFRKYFENSGLREVVKEKLFELTVFFPGSH